MEGLVIKRTQIKIEMIVEEPEVTEGWKSDMGM